MQRPTADFENTVDRHKRCSNGSLIMAHCVEFSLDRTQWFVCLFSRQTTYTTLLHIRKAVGSHFVSKAGRSVSKYLSTATDQSSTFLCGL